MTATAAPSRSSAPRPAPGSAPPPSCATRPAQSLLAASRDAQVRLRLDLEAKAKEALSTAARNADGTYRVPVEQAMELLARDNSRFEAFRQAAAKEQAAKQ